MEWVVADDTSHSSKMHRIGRQLLESSAKLVELLLSAMATIPVSTSWSGSPPKFNQQNKMFWSDSKTFDQNSSITFWVIRQTDTQSQRQNITISVMWSRLFQDQDLNFKTKSKLVFKTKTKTLHFKTFLWRILEADRKAFIIFGRKRKCRRKWNSIYCRKRNENENGHSFSAEKRKRKSPDNISVFFTFSYIQSPGQVTLYNAPPIPRPLSPFCRWSMHVDGIPLSSCRPTVYRYLCSIFLDDISTSEQFDFLVYCYRVKAIFHNLTICALLASVWPNK